MQVSAYPHERVADLGKAISDPVRLRVLGLLLQAGELCGCEVEATLGITQTRASRALTTLRRAGLVDARRDGAWVHYKVPAKPAGPLRSFLKALREALADDAAVQTDVGNLQRRCC